MSSSVVESLRPGDHVAFFYQSKQEQFSFVIPFIKIGLERNERCVYIADDNSVPLILRKLSEAGVAVEDALRRDALRVLSKHETYMRHGTFEPAKMVAEFEDGVHAALAAGYSALRATGEMTWALDLPSSLVRLIEYEERLHAKFPDGLLGLCQYDETRFPEHVIEEMVRLHPKVISRLQLVDRELCHSAD